MIPSYENMAKQAIVRVFNTIMTRAGITLIVTVAFSISSMFYNISTDYPFFMIAFLQIVCFAGIYMKLGDLMSMFSLNAGDSQSMGRRIFRRPYMFMRHRARRMENRLVRAVGKGSMVGAGTGAMAGSVLSSAGSKQSHTSTTRKRDNTSFGSRAGSAVGAVLDTKNKVKDKATAVKENIKDMRPRPPMPYTPQRKRQKQMCPTLSVALCRDRKPDRASVPTSSNSIDRISLTSVWSFKRHRKQSRLAERRTDQRQQELPVPMTDL